MWFQLMKRILWKFIFWTKKKEKTKEGKKKREEGKTWVIWAIILEGYYLSYHRGTKEILTDYLQGQYLYWRRVGGRLGHRLQNRYLGSQVSYNRTPQTLEHFKKEEDKKNLLYNMKKKQPCCGSRNRKTQITSWTTMYELIMIHLT